jgi:hypothetical protein
MATTGAAIRDAMIALVEAITPSTHAGDKFVAHREVQPFRDWADANPGGCLRRFSIRSTGALTPPEATNTDIEWVSTDFACVVAYPVNGRQGEDWLLDLDDVIEADLRAIEHRIGTNGYANYAQQTAGATVTTTGTAREEGGAVVYGVLELHAGFYRVMP